MYLHCSLMKKQQQQKWSPSHFRKGVCVFGIKGGDHGEHI